MACRLWYPFVSAVRKPPMRNIGQSVLKYLLIYNLLLKQQHSKVETSSNFAYYVYLPKWMKFIKMNAALKFYGLGSLNTKLKPCQTQIQKVNYLREVC